MSALHTRLNIKKGSLGCKLISSSYGLSEVLASQKRLQDEGTYSKGRCLLQINWKLCWLRGLCPSRFWTGRGPESVNAGRNPTSHTQLSSVEFLNEASSSSHNLCIISVRLKHQRCLYKCWNSQKNLGSAVLLEYSTADHPMPLHESVSGHVEDPLWCVALEWCFQAGRYCLQFSMSCLPMVVQHASLPSEGHKDSESYIGLRISTSMILPAQPCKILREAGWFIRKKYMDIDAGLGSILAYSWASVFA